jgi:hypothetical protein
MNDKYIAVAVGPDEDLLWDDHFGEAPCYLIYTRDGQLAERRANPYWRPDEEFHTGPAKIVALLADCDVFVARHMGNGVQVLRQVYGVSPFITNETRPQAALDALRGAQPAG